MTTMLKMMVVVLVMAIMMIVMMVMMPMMMMMMPMMMMMMMMMMMGQTLFPPVRLLHLLSCVGQIPRGPLIRDSFSARCNENFHNNCVCCVGGLVAKKCSHPRMKLEGAGRGAEARGSGSDSEEQRR